MITRSRCFALCSIGILAAAWFLRAEDPPVPPYVDRVEIVDAAWQWQCRVIVDRPALPSFQAGAKQLPASGRTAVVLVLAEGDGDPASSIRDLDSLSSRLADTDLAWVAPDEKSAERARSCKPAHADGGVAPEVCALVSPEDRPALLVVSASGKASYAHIPGFHWDLDLVVTEIAVLKRLQDSRLPAPSAPKPGTAFSGALACAACHRSQFVDWLFTPHSDAHRDLVTLKRDKDPACLGCHVTGWKQPGGFADPATDRRMADVQCGACHDPERTHAGENKIRKEEYAARCAACHTATASITPDIKLNIPKVSHPFAAKADSTNFDLRREAIRHFREHTYFEFCSRTAYVGADACKDCHAGAHAQWSKTGHPGAFETLKKSGKDTEPECVKCHATGVGHEGGFQDMKSTPGMAGVGCESCHGPGKLHVNAKSREERLETIFRFDDKCPTCVVQRICATCHDAENDPQFELGKRFARVKHTDR